MKNNIIIIIGFMASGKSTLAKFLEQKYNYKKLSTDEIVIDKKNMEISEIFKNFGEKHFRELEVIALDDIIKIVKNSNENFVVDCGGGIIKAQNFKDLAKIGNVYFLDTDFAKIISRLKDDTTRPLATSEEVLKDLYNQRYEQYLSYSDFVIDSEEENCEIIADKFIKIGLNR